MSVGPAGQVLHGGARRLAMRWPNRAEGAPLIVSRYEIGPGDVCSLHVHTGKVETWIVVAGSGVARIGDELFCVRAGDALVTPPGVPHELRNTGEAALQFLNVVLPTDEPITTTELSGAAP